jgi:hypothetical protein
MYDSVHNLLVLSISHLDVEPGDELTLSYGKIPKHLYQSYGFTCRCGACRPLSDEELKSLDNFWYD